MIAPAVDFSAVAPLDFAALDRAGAVVADPSDEVVTIHIRRPAEHIVGARDLWLSFATDDAEDLASRILDITGGHRRSATLIAFAMVAFSGAFVGCLLTILAIGAFQP
ncbi:MAG: hypothetical protein ACK4U0_17350 [Mesorhizobium sp.]